MDFFEVARRWAVLLLAEALNTSARVIERVLPTQPRWLAQIRLLEAQLRSAAGAGEKAAVPAAGKDAGAPSAPAASELEALLASYAILRQSLKDLEARGLGLDVGLLQRMTSEWSAESVVGYLQSCESRIRAVAKEALDRATAPLGSPFDSLTVEAARPCEPAAEARSTPKPQSGRPRKPRATVARVRHVEGRPR
ncbi:MAG: hypothetical protein ACE5GS_00595 [Kiloniellaceae bacterium]